LLWLFLRYGLTFLPWPAWTAILLFMLPATMPSFFCWDGVF
jgi:hypothetical protein